MVPLVILGGFLIVFFLYEGTLREQKEHIFTLKEENKSLKKQLTEAPFRRNHNGNG
jgi:hypothetical protein